MIGADARGGEFQRGTVLVGHQRAFGGDFCGGKAQRVRRQVQPVKARCQVNDRRIAARAYIGDDFGHDMIDIGAVFAFRAQQGDKAGLEIGISRGQELRH